MQTVSRAYRTIFSVFSMHPYLNPDDLVGQRKAIVPVSKPSDVASTYSGNVHKVPVKARPVEDAQLGLNLAPDKD